MTVEIVRSAGELTGLRDDWNALLELTPEGSGFQSHAWISTWLHRDLSRGREPHVGIVKVDRRVVAIFPMQLNSRGRLRFVGADVSNYAGPVFDPLHLEASVRAWAEQVRRDRRVHSLDLEGLRANSPFLDLVRGGGLPDWGRGAVVRTNTCPEVDLTSGWQGLLERHKSRQRSSWRRKSSRLERLGVVEFLETADADVMAESLPRISELWRMRWEGQRIGGGFGQTLDLQLQAARALATADLMLLSMLRIDGEIIAFAYGLRGRGYTSSYVLAHDSRFNRYSPGLLLLLRVLEAACERGDRMYDFSLGDAPYKAMWDTSEQDVYRAIWGRDRYARACWSAAWTRARSVESLRKLKLGGWRAVIRRGRDAARLSTRVGSPAGPMDTTFIYRVTGTADAAEMRPCSYRMMSELLSPGLLRLALERSFRGDDLLTVEDAEEPLGVVWLATAQRRALLVGEDLATAGEEVYYQPLAVAPHRLEDVIQRLPAKTRTFLVVTAEAVAVPAAMLCGRQPPDPSTWSVQGAE